MCRDGLRRCWNQLASYINTGGQCVQLNCLRNVHLQLTFSQLFCFVAWFIFCIFVWQDNTCAGMVYLMALHKPPPAVGTNLSYINRGKRRAIQLPAKYAFRWSQANCPPACIASCYFLLHFFLYHKIDTKLKFWSSSQLISYGSCKIWAETFDGTETLGRATCLLASAWSWCSWQLPPSPTQTLTRNNTGSHFALALFQCSCPP